MRLVLPRLQLQSMPSRHLRKTGCLRMRRGQPLETKFSCLKDSSCPHSCLSSPNGFPYRSSPLYQSFARLRRVLESDSRGFCPRIGSYNPTLSPHLRHHRERFQVNPRKPCRYPQVHSRWCRTPRNLPRRPSRFQSDDSGNALARKGQPRY